MARTKAAQHRRSTSCVELLASVHRDPNSIIVQLEAVVENDHGGLASQSLQLAPMDYRYIWDNTTAGTFDIYPSQQQTAINGYVGGAWQQACSALTTLPEASYELSDGEWSTFGCVRSDSALFRAFG